MRDSGLAPPKSPTGECIFVADNAFRFPFSTLAPVPPRPTLSPPPDPVELEDDPFSDHNSVIHWSTKFEPGTYPDTATEAWRKGVTDMMADWDFEKARGELCAEEEWSDPIASMETKLESVCPKTQMEKYSSGGYTLIVSGELSSRSGLTLGGGIAGIDEDFGAEDYALDRRLDKRLQDWGRGEHPKKSDHSEWVIAGSTLTELKYGCSKTSEKASDSVTDTGSNPRREL